MGQRNYNYDAEMQLKDAGLVAATAAAQVGGADKIIDLGVGRMEAVAVLDLTAIETDSSNELYTVAIQGSSSATFASDIQNLAMMDFGHLSTPRKGGAITSLVGRYEIPFVNEQNDIRYRYLRLHTTVAGTVATGANFSAFVAPKM